MTEAQISEFMSVSGSNRRTAMFFLSRQNGNLNNAVEDFFLNTDLEIPPSFPGDSDHGAIPGASSSQSPLSDDSSSSLPTESDTDSAENPPFSPSAHVEIPEPHEEPINQKKIVNESIFSEIDPRTLVLEQPIETIEPEDEKIFEAHSFPPQASKGDSEKLVIYKNGLYYQNKFHEKSNQELDAFLTEIQCGEVPLNIFSANVVDIELVDESSHCYSK